MRNGVFTISLDFELHWGVFDKRNRDERKRCYDNTRKLVPELISLFEAYQISATWATVGSLFVEDEAAWNIKKPVVIPAYKQTKYSPYTYASDNGIGVEYEWAHFAPGLVQMIAQSGSQELATHTFSHYYCLEEGQGIEAFKADLDAVQQVAMETTGEKLTSLVFPRNQYNKDYLAACYEAGITVIRSNPNTWYWTGIGNDDTSMLRKIFRTGDVFMPMGGRSTYPLESIAVEKSLPISLPASRLFRQYDASKKWLNKIRLRRILSELTYAAEQGECYHLWWHPENFGYHPGECMQEMELILQHFNALQIRHGIESWPMKQYAAVLLS